jgi:uncharacterized membrane protein
MATNIADVINNEYSRLSTKKLEVDTAIAGQQRAVLLNESYKKRFSRYTQIVMIISFTILLYLGILVLKKVVPVIPEWLLDVLFGLILFVAVLYCISIAQEISIRNITNYDELDLPPYVEETKERSPMTTLDEMKQPTEPTPEMQQSQTRSSENNLPSVSKSSEHLIGISVNDAFALITKH